MCKTSEKLCTRENGDSETQEQELQWYAWTAIQNPFISLCPVSQGGKDELPNPPREKDCDIDSVNEDVLVSIEFECSDYPKVQNQIKSYI